MKKSRTFNRSTGIKRYRKRFLIAAEGEKTEPDYFNFLNKITGNVVVIRNINALCGCNPKKILRRIKDEAKKLEFSEEKDEAWIIIDRDNWDENILDDIQAFVDQNQSYHFALSNPKFEYWLLLHFEDGNAIDNPDDCMNRLKQHDSKYNKSIDLRLYNRKNVLDAIERAKTRDKCPQNTWPKTLGSTRVYILAQRVLEA